MVETGRNLGLVLALKLGGFSESSKGLTVPTVPNNSGVFLVDFIFRQKSSEHVSVKAMSKIRYSMLYGNMGQDGKNSHFEVKIREIAHALDLLLLPGLSLVQYRPV